MTYDCLIIDDEELLSESSLEYFNAFGVKTARVDGADALAKFLKTNSADLFLLDVNLGDASGFELCRKLRENYDAPILFISARTADDDAILALNVGGDDYIQKPYSLAVLLAKVKAVLRRRKSKPLLEISQGDKRAQIDFEAASIVVNGEKVKLKTLEFKLLAYLAQNPNRVISKDEIFAKVWEDSIVGDNTLNVHIRRLREKIEENPNEPKFIKTAWGTGYIFETEGRK